MAANRGVHVSRNKKAAKVRQPIQDYAQLVTVLTERQASLSKRLHQFARFCLNHPEDVAISNIVTLASMANVPAATITRFAKELGFAGFHDLQAVFQQRLVGPRMTYDERLRAFAQDQSQSAATDLDLEHPGLVFDAFIQAAMDALLRLKEDVDRSALDDFVGVLLRTDAVHIIAARGAYGIGAYAFYGFSQVGKRAFMIDNFGTMRQEQLAAVSDDDVLLVLTFDDYTPETIELAKTARQRNKRILVITDNELSPAAPLGEQTLYVKEARLGHFRSQVPALVLCQSIIVSLGRQLDRRAGN